MWAFLLHHPFDIILSPDYITNLDISAFFGVFFWFHYQPLVVVIIFHQ